MLIFICTNFSGHYPVGTAAVIVAKNAAEASLNLKAELLCIGLDQEEGWTPELKLVEPTTPKVIILRDGNY